jgi:hypothetical protein
MKQAHIYIGNLEYSSLMPNPDKWVKAEDYLALWNEQSIPTKYPEKIEAFMKLLTEGCGTCTYDEAEGGLTCHCTLCCFKVTSAAYELFVNNKASIIL